MKIPFILPQNEELMLLAFSKAPMLHLPRMRDPLDFRRTGLDIGRSSRPAGPLVVLQSTRLPRLRSQMIQARPSLVAAYIQQPQPVRTPRRLAS